MSGEINGIIEQSSISDAIGFPLVFSKTKGLFYRKYFSKKLLCENASVTEFKVIESADIEGQKSTGKKIAGGIVGGLLTGGAGAVVGALALGNSKTGFDLKVGISFGDNWVVVRYKHPKGNSLVGLSIKGEIEKMQKTFATNAVKPF